MVKIAPTGRIGQQIGVKPYIKRAAPVQPTSKVVPKTQGKKVNYEAAWETAKKHWSKGMAGAYVFHMKREAREDPQIGAVYAYVKELRKQTKIGNISPGRSKGSLLATPSEVAKQIHNREFFNKRQVPIPGDSDFIGPVKSGDNLVFNLPGETRPTTTPSMIIGPVKSGDNLVTTTPSMIYPSIEAYSQDIGAYTSPVYGSGYGGTSYLRQPTYEESLAITKAEDFTVTGSAVKGIKWYGKNVVEPLSGSSGFKWYEKNIVEPTSKNIVEPFKENVFAPTSGLIGSGIEKFKDKVVVPLRETFPSLGDTPVGQIAQAVRIIKAAEPDTTFRIGLPGQVRDVPASQLQGSMFRPTVLNIYSGEVATAFTSIGSKGDFSQKYFGATPEQFGKGVAFINELAATTPFFAGSGRALVGSRTNKLRKFLDKPLSKDVLLKGETKTQNIFKPTFILSKEYRQADGLSFLKFTPKKKGGTEVSYNMLTGKYIGKVAETRKGILPGTSKDFLGKATMSKEGIYKETLDLGRGWQRVIEVGKDGLGKAKLVKKGKERASLDVNFPQSFKNVPMKGVPLEMPGAPKIRSGEGTKLFERGIFRNIDTGAPLRNVKTNIPKGSSGDLKGTIKTKGGSAYMESGIDPKTGFYKSSIQQQSFKDVVKVGPARGSQVVRKGKDTIVQRKKAGQQLEYADDVLDTTTDSKMFLSSGKYSALLKTEVPTIQRKFVQKLSFEVRSGFKSPKLIAKESKATLKVARKQKAFGGEARRMRTLDLGKITPLGKSLQVPSRQRAGELLLIHKQKSKSILSNLQTKTKVAKPQTLLKEIQPQKIKDIPLLAQARRAKSNVSFGVATATATSTATALTSSTKSSQSEDTSSIFDSATAQSTAQDSLRSSLTGSASGRASVSRSISKMSSGRYLRLKTPKKLKPKIDIKLPSMGKPLLSKITKQQGYKPQAKSKGGKWITLSKEPMTRQSALSRASRASDETLSAQFRIKKVKGNVTNGIDNYFGVTQRKYRPYKIKKGKKIALHNQFIEKRGSRLDTRGEKKGIKLAKYAKQRGWIGKRKKKKTKSPWLI